MFTPIKKQIVSLYILVFILCLPQNSTTYQAQPLNVHDYQKNYYQETASNVTLTVKRLSKQEIKTLFNNQGENLSTHRPRIIPLHISFTNMSNETLVITKNAISLDCIDYNRIIKRLSYCTSNYTVQQMFSGILFGSSLLGVAFSLGTLGTLYTVPTMIYAAHTSCFLSAIELCVIAPFQGYSTYKHYKNNNQLIAYDIQKKTLHDTLYIEPNTQSDFLIFVHHKKLKQPFAVTCLSKKTKIQSHSFIVSF